MAHYGGPASEGGRAIQMQKRREKHKEEVELKKIKIEEESVSALNNINKKFEAHYDAVESSLKHSTVGLVTFGEMKAKQQLLVEERQRELARKESQLKEIKTKKHSNKNVSKLSFEVDDDDVDDEDEVPRKVAKNPDVDTSFLPDKEREEEENKLREELRREWIDKQETIKEEVIEITYSYWDGSGHRRTVEMKKGNSIQQLLQKVLKELRNDFIELRTASTDQLIFVKEDLLIPHHYTFYDFIVTKARGKSGPLFQFDARDDVRLESNAAVEKDETHAGKVALRSWYERNKHIFPASRWEPYDAEKKWGKYTVKDKLNKNS